MYHKHRLPGIFSNYFRLNDIVHDHDTCGSDDLHATLQLTITMVEEV